MTFFTSEEFSVKTTGKGRISIRIRFINSNPYDPDS